MRRRNLISLIGIVVIAVGSLALTIGLGYAPKLGLDLQGGASVTLLPEGNVSSDALDQAVQIIRQRVDALGVAEPEITRQGNAIVVNLPGVKDQDRALQLVGQTAELRFRPVLEILPPDRQRAASGAPRRRRRHRAGPSAVDHGGAAPPPRPPAVAPGDRPLPAQDAPTTAAPTATTAAPATTAAATTAPDDGHHRPRHHDARERPGRPAGRAAAARQQGQRPAPLPPRPGVPDRLGRERRRRRLPERRWAVSLNMKGGANGIDTWNKVTEECFNGVATCPGIGSAGRGLVAITLDGTVKSAPEIQPDNQPFSPFSADQISISGNFTEGEANDLALVLRYGALPVKLEPQAVQTVSATLGKDSLRAGVIAGVIGVSLVILFMLLYYRSLGIVVLGGILVSAAILWAVISWLGETRGLALTLAGATGIIVSVGVTVDSYVVYFERLKDDARLGRTFRSSAQRGLGRAPGARSSPPTSCR